MNTFLPLPDFRASAAVLDGFRLRNQVNECASILRTLYGLARVGWPNHPATKMWRGYEQALNVYAVAIADECVARGYSDRTSLFIRYESPTIPPWLGDAAFHASHRSNLLRKDAAYYSQFGWQEPHDLPYVWPKGTLR